MSEDPKREAGAKKVPLQLVPTVFARWVAYVLKHGADKYGAWNWRESDGVRAMTYVGAIRRHLDAWVDGQNIDDESGCPHVAHVAACCAILLDAWACDKLIDDRPVKPARRVGK